MGIWSKGKVLSAGEVMTETYAENEPFVLFGMGTAGEIDLQNGLPPATKTVMLAQRVESGDKGVLVLKDDPKVIGAFSQPIGDMAAEATPDDFPVVVCWQSVHTKNDRDAIVLNLVADRDVPAKPDGTIPMDWDMYAPAAPKGK